MGDGLGAAASADAARYTLHRKRRGKGERWVEDGVKVIAAKQPCRLGELHPCGFLKAATAGRLLEAYHT